MVEQAVAERPRRSGLPDLPRSVLERIEEHARLFGQARTVPPVASLDRHTVEVTPARFGGNMAAAAQALGKDRGQFYRILRRLGIDSDRFRGC